MFSRPDPLPLEPERPSPLVWSAHPVSLSTAACRAAGAVFLSALSARLCSVLSTRQPSLQTAPFTAPAQCLLQPDVVLSLGHINPFLIAVLQGALSPLCRWGNRHKDGGSLPQVVKTVKLGKWDLNVDICLCGQISYHCFILLAGLGSSTLKSFHLAQWSQVGQPIHTCSATLTQAGVVF